MNIYDQYPEEVELDGKIYPLNLSYDRVLMAIDLQGDNSLTAQDRLETQCTLLLARRKDLPESDRTRARLLRAVLNLLPKSEKTGEKYIDFHQDAAMIRSAFFRIGIDLLKDKIHIIQFLELLADLPSDTALMRTVEIRQRPLPKPTNHNAEQIAALQKAKDRVAIKITEEERRERFAQSLKNSTLLRG